MKQLDFAVVVPVFNDGSNLTETVSSIVDQQFPQSVQIIVVDDGSDDLEAGLLQEVSALGATVVVNHRNEGPSAARNLGAAHATAGWIVFVDSDSVLVESALATFADAIDDATGLVRARAAWMHDSDGPADKVFLPGTFTVARSVFEAVGGYDVKLRYAENTDLEWRLTAYVQAAGLEHTTVDQPTVLLRSVGKGHNYDGHRMDAAIRMLEKHSAHFAADRRTRAEYQAIVAVNALRTKHWRQARRYAWHAALSDPSNPRHLLRAFAALGGPVFARRWEQ
jgi:glycosyltransferase involved in cell wall biosynthesis